jgi:uncharacterized protein YyaL (SSP411 family)
MSNYLEFENSPYLTSHKNSSINWHPWTEKTFKKAQDEHKSIFLSIGQSYSHWCSLMEEESFSQEPIAELINERFIAIKVDSQEHPELAKYYQRVHKLMNRSTAGFPLSIFMTENLEPFYAGSYIAPEAQKELLGFEALLRVVSKKYITDYDTLVAKGREILENINPKIEKIEATKLHINVLNTLKIHTKELLDNKNGGFGSSPKFPNTSTLELLLDGYELTKENSFLDAVLLSLDNMYKGGLYDHKNGGFYSYSQESNWQNPYPLKTTYDNALLAKLYLRTYQLTDTLLYKEIAFKTLDFMLSQMSESKLFFSKNYQEVQNDQMIITSWNSMMISTLFIASTLDEKYKKDATDSLDALLSTLFINSTLYHSTQIGSTPKIKAFLEDYAYLGETCITAYQSTLDESYLIRATHFANVLIEQFYKYGKWNFSNGLFSITEETFDSVYPSSLSVASSLMMSISSLVDSNYKKFVFKTLELNSYNLMRQPLSSPALTQLLLRYLKDDIIIKSNETALKNSLHKRNSMGYPFVLFKTTLDENILLCNSHSSFASEANFEEIKRVDEYLQ